MFLVANLPPSGSNQLEYVSNVVGSTFQRVFVFFAPFNGVFNDTLRLQQPTSSASQSSLIEYQGKLRTVMVKVRLAKRVAVTVTLAVPVSFVVSEVAPHSFISLSFPISLACFAACSLWFRRIYL